MSRDKEELRRGRPENSREFKNLLKLKLVEVEEGKLTKLGWGYRGLMALYLWKSGHSRHSPDISLAAVL